MHILIKDRYLLEGELNGADKQESIVDMGKEQAQIRLGFPVAVADEDQAAFDVMTSILSYRMMFDLRETRGLAYRLSISSGSDGSSQWLTAAMGITRLIPACRARSRP